MAHSVECSRLGFLKFNLSEHLDMSFTQSRNKRGLRELCGMSHFIVCFDESKLLRETYCWLLKK